MTIVILEGMLHTWTFIPPEINPWESFAGASEGGGTPPDWTQDDDPETAIPPRDAAGTLWRQGETETIPETIEETAEFFGKYVTGVPCEPIAAYFSSGGRGVFLIKCGTAHYVLVGRGSRVEDCPRVGASEHSMCRRVGMSIDEVNLF